MQWAEEQGKINTNNMQNQHDCNLEIHLIQLLVIKQGKINAMEAFSQTMQWAEEQGKINAMEASMCKVSHLIFADDLMSFAPVTKKKAQGRFQRGYWTSAFQ
jgi:hypothetical protein